MGELREIDKVAIANSRRCSLGDLKEVIDLSRKRRAKHITQIRDLDKLIEEAQREIQERFEVRYG